MLSDSTEFKCLVRVNPLEGEQIRYTSCLISRLLEERASVKFNNECKHYMDMDKKNVSKSSSSSSSSSSFNGGREGIVDTHIKVNNTGYFYRKLAPQEDQMDQVCEEEQPRFTSSSSASASKTAHEEKERVLLLLEVD